MLLNVLTSGSQGRLMCSICRFPWHQNLPGSHLEPPVRPQPGHKVPKAPPKHFFQSLVHSQHSKEAEGADAGARTHSKAQAFLIAVIPLMAAEVLEKLKKASPPPSLDLNSPALETCYFECRQRFSSWNMHGSQSPRVQQGASSC